MVPLWGAIPSRPRRGHGRGGGDDHLVDRRRPGPPVEKRPAPTVRGGRCGNRCTASRGVGLVGPQRSARRGWIGRHRSAVAAPGRRNRRGPSLERGRPDLAAGSGRLVGFHGLPVGGDSHGPRASGTGGSAPQSLRIGRPSTPNHRTRSTSCSTDMPTSWCATSSTGCGSARSDTAW